ncbi:hypothetical protein [Streptomyces sp. NPDC102360]|uniref:hypothetical protein n=1 Tax=Streptomyces sp. NPDC102360 TaxID=3366160 RepID=UPI00380E874C
MRKRIVVISLLALFLPACSAADKPDHGTNTGARSSATSSASATPSVTSSPLDLKLPKKAVYLLPVTSGTKSSALKPFTAEGGVYTVHVTCTGQDEIAIKYRGNPEKTKITCGGPVTVGRVYADKEKQYLSIRSPGHDVRWSIAVLTGAHKL